MRFSIPEGVLYQEFPDEAVVLNLAKAEYFHLNSVGQRTWQLVRSGAGRETIETTLVREYEAPAEKIRSDLEGFLKHMMELKLIKAHPE